MCDVLLVKVFFLLLSVFCTVSASYSFLFARLFTFLIQIEVGFGAVTSTEEPQELSDYGYYVCVRDNSDNASCHHEPAYVPIVTLPLTHVGIKAHNIRRHGKSRR